MSTPPDSPPVGVGDGSATGDIRDRPPTAAGVRVGDELPSLSISLDRTLIVATAIATRDYHPVHHDPDYARNSGSQDVFTNILTSQGMVSRFVTDWAGPNAVLKKIAIRLGAGNYPGDTLRLTGEVLAAQPGTEGCLVEIAVRGVNSRGDHVKGTVTLALPDSQGPGS